jgi:hypothetical protein
MRLAFNVVFVMSEFLDRLKGEIICLISLIEHHINTQIHALSLFLSFSYNGTNALAFPVDAISSIAFFGIED